MTLQDFTRAIRGFRGLADAKIETMPYGDGSRTKVIVSGTPSEFPVVTFTSRGRWDIPDVASFPENGTLTAFDAAVHADVLLAYVRSGKRGKRDTLYPHVVLTAPAEAPAPRTGGSGTPSSTYPQRTTTTTSAVPHIASPPRAVMMLRNYFENLDQQQRALEAYGKFAGCKDWSVGQKIKMYEAASRAFDPMVPEHEALRAFQEEIYEILRREWGVFRGYSPTMCWPPKQIFETIKKEFSQFAWGGPVTLPKLISSGKREALLSSLKKMETLKPTGGYPVMAVSKFLHFYNPALFPIYDNAVIWDQVFKRFKSEFKEFCSIWNLPYDIGYTAVFLRNYVCWGSSLVAAAHPKFMGTFRVWLGGQPGSKLPLEKFDASSLYATAFEFTAIGATQL